MAAICHESGPPGTLRYWKCTWDEEHLGIKSDFTLEGRELRRLLRLRPDYRDVPGWKPLTREEFMTIAAREALRDGNCEVVGGFIRDWIIRGEAPKDVDLRLWKAFDFTTYIARCQGWGLTRFDQKNKLGFMTPDGDRFLIDYVFADDDGDGPRSIDLDVNSFAVSADVGLHKREYLNRPICKTYQNIKNKVAYLINNDPGDKHCAYMEARVKKMEERGWHVIRSNSLHCNCKGNA